MISVDGTVVTTSPVVRGDQATIALSTSFPSGSIFYTVDGSEPTGASTRYTAPFNITSTKTIRAIAYSADFSQSATAGPIEVQIAPTFALTISTPKGGSVTLDPAPSNGRYISNTIVQVTAQPSSAWKFLTWTGSVTTTSNPLSVTITSNINLTAIFSGKVQFLAASHGNLHLDPFSESEDIPYGSVVNVTPIPETGYYLAAYGADASGAANPYTFTLTSPLKTISALFLPLPEGKATLSAYTTSRGGTVTVDRRLTECPDQSTCYPLPPTNLYTAGEMAVITATPNPGYAFTGWSGDASGQQNPLAVTIQGSTVIQANFAPGGSISVLTSGGNVTKNPDLAAYSLGSSVTLQANPDAAYAFDSFIIGTTRITDNPYTFEIRSNTLVIARFNGTNRQPLWSYDGPSASAPFAADDAGNSYVSSGANNGFSWSLVALDNQGGVRWIRGLNRQPTDIAIDPSGNVVLFGNNAGNHSVLRFSSNNVAMGSSDWYDSITHLLSWGPISISRDGVVYAPTLTDTHEISPYDSVVPAIAVYFGDQSHRAITSLGGDYIYYGNWGRPALGADGRLYFPALVDNRGDNGVLAPRAKLYSADPGGNILWSQMLEGENFYGNVVLGNGSVYAEGGKGRLWSFGYDGSLQWSVIAGEPLSTPSIGADGTLYTGRTNLYAYNSNGSLKWVRSPGSGNYPPPAIGSDGTIYVTDFDSLYALNLNGDRLWQYRGAFGVPIISSNIVFVHSSTGIVAIPANATGPANSPWPMNDATSQQTASVRDVIPAPAFDLANSFMASDGFHVIVHSSPGATVTLYGSQDLQSWNLVQTTTATAGGSATFVDSLGGATRFYRVSAN